MDTDATEVHVTHCCFNHGCSYGGSTRTGKPCPVKNGTQKQAYPCEYCRHPSEIKTELNRLQEELVWSEKIWIKRKYYG